VRTPHLRPPLPLPTRERQSGSRAPRRLLTIATVAVAILTSGGCGDTLVPQSPPSVAVSAAPELSPAPRPTIPSPSANPGLRPTRIVIPAIDVDSKVTPVGAPKRILEIPAKPWVIGWWDAGVGVGSDHGAAVLAAHIATRRFGPGPLRRATELKTGSPMTVLDEKGAARKYVVASVDTYEKAVLPYERIFDQSGPAKVVLVTCGGEFRPALGHWDSNVVVTFQPA
jgi:Sortase domain